MFYYIDRPSFFSSPRLTPSLSFLSQKLTQPQSLSNSPSQIPMCPSCPTLTPPPPPLLPPDSVWAPPIYFWLFLAALVVAITVIIYSIIRKCRRSSIPPPPLPPSPEPKPEPVLVPSPPPLPPNWSSFTPTAPPLDQMPQWYLRTLKFN